ncbi:MAG: protein kinase [Myxococcota bacterium]|jgi:serine/threonine-protein kinase
MLAAGTKIGRYEVTRKLAEGGMAEIYLARAVGPEGFSKDVVIKVVRSFLATDPQFVQMFIAEARLASKLNHANVVQIFDFGKHDDTYYLAMEYVRGASLWDLRQRCRREGVPFPVTLAAELGTQVARGLQYAHTLTERGQKIGVVHRDVTPHNVLLSFDGAVKLTDFGIAKATTTHTAPGMLKGKFAYMSPEQARGERVDARTDIFALGIVLWELLTGGRLFDGDSELAVLRAVEESVIAPPARLNPDVPQDLSDIVMKALARPLPERFQSAFELEKALATWVLRTAQSVEDTSIALFLQQLYRAEMEADERPGTPAHGAAAVVRAAEDDFGTGDTMAVDRSRQHAKAAPLQPTMTMTPVRQSPRSATPRPRGVTDDLAGASPAATIEVPGFAEQLASLRAKHESRGTEQVPPHKPGTEQMPAYQPRARQPVTTQPMAEAAGPKTDQYKPLSRRLEPLVVQDVSQVKAPPPSAPSAPSTEPYRPPSRRLEPIVPAEPSLVAPSPAEPSGPTASETQPAAPDELPGALPEKVAPSRMPFVALGAVAVIAVAVAGAFFATRNSVDPPAPPIVDPGGGAAGPGDPGTTTAGPSGTTVPFGPAEVDAGASEPVVDAGTAEPVDAGAAEPVDAGDGVEPGTGGGGGRLPPTGPVTKKPTGALVVRATPYADVFDGKRILAKELQGTRTFSLPIGTHDIVFVHRNKTEKRRVVIKTNETATEYFDALQ